MKSAKRIVLVAAARPNFMKIAPLLHELAKFPGHFEPMLIHTGQHYDPGMSEIFFKELEIRPPDRHLGVGSGSHAEQTGLVMIAFEKVCLDHRCDLVVVVGDVNSTMACAITAKKLVIPIAHIEAGLRSRDWTMPEEVNRVVTDSVSDLLFTPSRDADENLLREGVSPDRIHFVGNIMIDSLVTHLPKTIDRPTLDRFHLKPGCYATLTLHRPSNVDDPDIFAGLMEVLTDTAEEMPIVWPVHPRARKALERLQSARRMRAVPGLIITEPLGYLDMLTLNRNARVVITDSGGLQEEATFLRVPCLTLRENTERPVTVQAGANQVVGTQPARVRAALASLLHNGARRPIEVPELWDGRTSERIVRVIERL